MIVPLHNHSEYSAIDGVSTPKEIAQRVITDMGCPCCGITDHGVVAGHLEFDKEIRAAGGKPIFGCELYHGVRFGEKLGNKRDQAHLIALAMTDEGLLNLWRLNDAAAQEEQFHHVGRNSWEDLRKYGDGIVFTSACVASLVCQGIIRDDYDPLNKYLDIVRDNFYIELATYPGDQIFNDGEIESEISSMDLNKALVSVAQERGIPLVYGDDGHYAFPDQWAAHNAYVARSTKDDIFTPPRDRKMWHPEGALCIKTEDEVRAALSYLPKSVVDEAISNSVEIGTRADAHLPDTRRHLPVFVPSDSPWVEQNAYEDDDAAGLFLDLIEEGMYKRYGDDPSDEVIEQTAKEAEIFIKDGLHHYFLLAWDTIQFCDNAPGRPIERGPGRGSSAGCIVAYELGITDVDPLPYELYFERFWNPGRAKGFPDIDSDFEKGRRKEIKGYLTRRWGHDRVRSIGSIMRMKPKAVIEKMHLACGVSYSEADALKKIVEKTPDLEILGTDQIGWSEEVDPGKVVYVMEEVGDKIVEWVSEQPVDRQEILVDFLGYCELLCNRVFSYGVHASGIVVSDADLPIIAPCRFAGSKTQRIPVTQFPMDEIDALGLVKLDILGLNTLDVLADWKEQMAKHEIELDWSGLEEEEHPQEMWDLLKDGYAAGVFQIERGFPKRLAEDFAPQNVEDLSIIVALNRPGPINSGAPESFVIRRQGGSDDKFDGRKIPLLADILEPTYGWFLYQEQVIAFFEKLGYDKSDADAVRKILGKKQPEKWAALHDGLDEWENKSYAQRCAENGLDPSLSEEIWKMLVEFGKYSFNKSHAIAYAVLSLRTTFAKYYGDSEFYMSCIRNVDPQKKAERTPEYINEARRKGIEVHRPDIEWSDVGIGVYDGDIYFGFNDVKNVSYDGAKFLVQLRGDDKFNSPEELDAVVTQLSAMWSKDNKELVKANKPKLEGKSPKQRLNSGHIQNLYTAGAWERLEGNPTPMHEMQARELEMLSVILTDNTKQVFMNNVDAIDECDTYEEAKMPYDEDRKFKLPGVISNIRETKTKAAGKKMGIVTIEYEGDSLEFAVFPDAWRGSKFLWKERTPGIFIIKHSLSKSGQAGYHFDNGWKLS
jgi:DNA polymerase-3 subunit alpha